MKLGWLLLAMAASTVDVRAACLTDTEIDAAVGAQVRSGALIVDTRAVPDRPLCSGLTLAQAMQRIRAVAFPEERKRAEDASADLIAREEASAPSVAPPVVAIPSPSLRSAVRTASAARRAAPKRKVRAKSSAAPRRVSSAYYPNCSAARAAGAAPIRAGDPGYSGKLDRDGDGIACE